MNEQPGRGEEEFRKLKRGNFYFVEKIFGFVIRSILEVLEDI